MHARLGRPLCALASCTRFKASVGIDDEVGANGSVVFEVYAGATKVYDTGLMTAATATKTIDVSIAGASELRLVVTTAATTSTTTTPTGRSRGSNAAGGSDTTPPTIVSTTPAPGATGVAVGRLSDAPPSPRR